MIIPYYDGYLLFITVVTFLLYGLDKLCAVIDLWRVPEKTLFLFSLIGGAVGALGAMIMFRHKIHKPVFFVVHIIGVILHAFLLLYVWRAK